MTTKTALAWLRTLFSKSHCVHSQRMAGVRLHSSDISQTVLSKKIPIFHVRQIDPEGEMALYEVPKSTFYNELGLTARDLRFQHSHMLSARNCKIIIRIQKLKAVICSNAVLLVDSISPNLSRSLVPSMQFQPDDPTVEFIEQLPLILKENNLHTQNLPFEYRVLEAILSHSIEAMTAEIHDIEPKIQNLLETLTDPTNMDVDRSLVHILLQCNASLNKFSTIVKEFCQMLDDPLEYEDDLKELCISVEPNDYIKSPSLYNAYVFSPVEEVAENNESKNHLRSLSASKPPRKYRVNLLDEMEMLLDSYLKEVEEISNKVAELKQAIENSNSAILINLDSHRNMLLRLELQLTMGMFSCTYFGMLGMAFGMNLNSSLEENAMAFWLVTGIMFFGAGISWALLQRIIKKPSRAAHKAKTKCSKTTTAWGIYNQNGSKTSPTGTRSYCTLVRTSQHHTKHGKQIFSLISLLRRIF